MNRRRRQMRVKVLNGAITQDFSTWDKATLVQHARDLGLNASSRWKTDTIIRKIKEISHA